MPYEDTNLDTKVQTNLDIQLLGTTCKIQYDMLKLIVRFCIIEEDWN